VNGKGKNMGAHLYCYFTPYREQIDHALQALRRQEFQAGHYDPALQSASPPAYTFQLRFPPGDRWPSPGARHATIEEALEEREADGTGSILDIVRISDSPDFRAACPVAGDDLTGIFGTSKPARELISRAFLETPGNEKAWDYLESMQRGHARYIVAFEDDKPAEVFFFGYSFD
jgi:hypothetical protein